jgi:hypothetical protein
MLIRVYHAYSCSVAAAAAAPLSPLLLPLSPLQQGLKV